MNGQTLWILSSLIEQRTFLRWHIFERALFFSFVWQPVDDISFARDLELSI